MELRGQKETLGLGDTSELLDYSVFEAPLTWDFLVIYWSNPDSG